MFLIDGIPSDVTSMLVKQRLDSIGVETALIETTLFPKHIQISYDPEQPQKGKINLNNGRGWIYLHDIQGVYRRGSKWIESHEDYEFMSAEIIYWNIESALGSLYRLSADRCKWVNPLVESMQHKHKCFQLNQMSELGIRIPKTLVTNNAEDIQTFYEQQEGKIILKYPQGGKNTVRLNQDDIKNPDFQKHLHLVPAKIQECVEGIDIRAYVLNDEIFALEIHADTVDFRETPTAFRKAIELPEAIKQQCLALREKVGLIFTGIDMKRTELGEHVFFEANPTPVFLYDEVATGYPISQSIANYLVS
jgi:glutathione synthase/RimK-type ligase-like ATP-grasp enzyme